MVPIWIKDENKNYLEISKTKKIEIKKINHTTPGSNSTKYTYILFIDDIKIASSEEFSKKEENTEKILKRKKQLECYREIIAKFLQIEPLIDCK